MMSATSRRILVSAAVAASLSGLMAYPLPAVAASEEARQLNELRNTVVNLLQGLVERGVMTREQAEAMVTSAQRKAAEDAAAADAADAADAGAVRVPYVPEVVKEEIRKQVMAELEPQVTKNVIEEAENEQWGVPAALPDWIRRIRWYGDVRVRGQGDLFAPDNITDFYLDYLAVNDAGGAAAAGEQAFLNVTQDRGRMRGRIRLGLESELGWGWSLGARLTSGDLRDPVSTNQTLANYGNRYQVGLDLGYLKWYGNSATGRHVFSTTAGRIPNPWLSSELVWDPDLTFEGIAANYRLGLMRDDPYSHFAFLTLGAFPLQEVELSTKDKWLYGGQLGFEWKFAGGSRARFGAAYYYYDNIRGQRNTVLNGEELDFTAPPFLQKGNTLFNIRNSTDTTQELYALAANYELANATFNFDWRVSPGVRVGLTADYVRNLGLDADEVRPLTPRPDLYVEGDSGYQAELNVGSAAFAQNAAWRAALGYRYVESDAVLDAFTDSDFHLGGTDAKGYYVTLDYAFTPRVWARIRYMSANEIDGPPLGIDLVQLDVNAQF
jgi:hypothetical protein